MIIHLLRHGETGHNKGRLGLGLADVPLTPYGVQQAEALAAHFANHRLDRIFCSPLQRASVLASLVANGRGIIPEPRPELLEMDIGETEGMEFPAMRAAYPDFFVRWSSGDTSVAMPGGESLDDVACRLEPFSRELLALQADEIAVVSHNFITKLLVCQLIGLPVAMNRSLTTDLASITTISVGPNGRSTLRVLNDTCHLEHLEQTGGEV